MAGWGQKDRAGDGLGKTNAEKNPLPRGYNHAVGTPDKYGDIPLFGIDMEVFHIYEKCGIIHTSPAPGTRLCVVGLVIPRTGVGELPLTHSAGAFFVRSLTRTRYNPLFLQ